MRKLSTTALLGACMLSSCYTNVNQAWFQRQHSGYVLDYHTDEAAGLRGLSPQLYRCGEDWYIAAFRSDVRVRERWLHFVAESYRERHVLTLTPQPGRPVSYHKITPEMAGWLLRSDQESYAWLTEAKVTEELAKAGGEWLDTLPPGAKPVEAEFLKHCRTRTEHVEVRSAEDPWYAYPMSGLTFVCVDVPCSAAATALSAAALLGLLYLDSKLTDDEDDEDSLFTFEFESKKSKRRKADDTPPPPPPHHAHDKRPHAAESTRPHHHTHRKRHDEHAHSKQHKHDKHDHEHEDKHERKKK